MSGGVDSAVAATLLREAGHDIVGVTLRTAPWEAPEDAASRFGSCCSPATASTARQVARVLGIPYYFLNHEQEFGARVVADFTREYAAGRTPSPCVVCNREIKFGTLLDRARAWDAEAVATGHYARVAPDPTSGRVQLLTARDEAKDQSYFLWPHHPGAARPGALSDRWPEQERGSGAGAGAWARRGGGPGEPGALLRERRLPDVPSRAGAGGVSARTDRG